MRGPSKKEFFREQSSQNSLQDNKKSINMRQACDALLQGLNIPRDSTLGKRLVAGTLNFDEESGIYWIPGEVGMDLSNHSFRIYTPENDPRFSRCKRGRFYFAETGELKAKIIDY
jgi:hypothetical protein